MYDIYNLLNDVFFEVIRMAVLLGVMVAGVLAGKKLRDYQDKKKVSEGSMDK